jgi:DNA-binding MarR family transcriptional regulator
MSEKEFDLDDFLGYIMGTTFLSLQNLFQKKIAEAEIGITVEQAKVINLLKHRPGSNQMQLAQALRKDKPAITRLLESLEKQYLVLRKEDEIDRRNKRIFLTDDGDQKHAEMAPIREEFFALIQTALDEQELEEVKRILKKLRSKLMEEHEKYQG